MKASVLDLRYRMKEVLEALARRELVYIYHRNKLKGSIHPHASKSTGSVLDHPFFGSGKDKSKSVSDVMKRLRQARFAK